MNEIGGIVVRTDLSHAWVRPAGTGNACGSCSSRESCGTTGLLSEGNAAKTLLRLPNTIQAQVGDEVVIRAADGAVMRAVWHVYLLPLLLALVFAAILLEFTGNEVLAFLGMIAGLAGGYLTLRFIQPVRRGSCSGQVLSIGFKNS